MGSIRQIPIINKSILFEDCDDMTIWNYTQIMNTGNLKLLLKSGPTPSKKRLEDRMEQINKQFSNLRGENNTVKVYDLISYKEELILQVNFGAALLDTLQTQVLFNIIAPKTFEGLLEELESWGFFIDRELPMIETLENIKSEIDALQMTIDALQEEIYPTKEETPETEHDEEKTTFNLHVLLLIYERILKKSNIDPKTTSLTAFAAIEKNVEEIKKLTTNTNDKE